MDKATCDEKCYDLASEFLEDHPGIWHHANCLTLGTVIQRAIDDWIEDAKANYTPETI